MAWLPSSYAWGNFTMLAIGVWAIAQRDSIDAVVTVGYPSRLAYVPTLSVLLPRNIYMAWTVFLCAYTCFYTY